MRYLTVVIVFCCCWACYQSPTSEKVVVQAGPQLLPENEAGNVVLQAMNHVGGWDQWSSRNYFSFYKDISYLDSTGQVERHVRQLHQYQLQPRFRARITWQEDGKDYLIINDGDQAKKYENGQEMTDDRSKNQAWNSSYGSHYVVTMPFKLTDPGVILSYEGIDSTTLDEPVISLKVEYESGAGSSGGYHTWWYYFDPDNYDLVANYLDYGEGLSLTTYETFKDVEGIRIHGLRNSYISNNRKERVLLRTIYRNDEMHYPATLPANLFTQL